MAKEVKNGETRQLLLQCAKKEFMEKGYSKASLRSICKEAGVTTGALYFFFQDKDDLFCSLVSDSLMRIMELIKEHQQFEENEAKEEILSRNHDMESERILVEVLVHEMYQNRDEMLLLVNGAQGSSLENAVDRIIDEMDAHNLHLARATCQELGIPMLEENLVHWMSHNQIDMFLYMLKHIETEEQALVFGRQAMTYLVTGWFALFGVDLSEK
ncbi:transcriptional regulator TetR family [Roseburia sp. CAG:309]|nr:transcriptional regulator TetR family [Roseburia sp. CAG:309]